MSIYKKKIMNQPNHKNPSNIPQISKLYSRYQNKSPARKKQEPHHKLQNDPKRENFLRIPTQKKKLELPNRKRLSTRVHAAA